MKARTSIHKAGPDDIERLVPMIVAFHDEEGMETEEAHIRHAIGPLLAGSPHGEIFLAGPRLAPAGYAMICYGWSIEYGGLDAYLDEFYLRAAVRGRGMGSDVLHAISTYLAEKGAGFLALEVDFENTAAMRAYEKSGFERRHRYGLMVRTLT